MLDLSFAVGIPQVDNRTEFPFTAQLEPGPKRFALPEVEAPSHPGQRPIVEGMVFPATQLRAVALFWCASMLYAQVGSQPAQPTATTEQRKSTPRTSPTATEELQPLPDIPTLMHEVEANQRKAEAVEKNYIFHSAATEQEVDGHGKPTKTTVTESDHYWLNGVPIRRMVKKDGKDLTAAELAKEDERIQKEAAKARERRDKGDASGKETDPDGHEEITVSRLLELGAFTHPRRVELSGRPTIVVDYTGDPHAKTRNRGEDVLRDMAGTVWVDEQDRMLARIEGHFVDNFKIGAGLIADIRKGTQFSAQLTKVNDEVWLISTIDGQGSARAFLFFSFNGRLHVVDSNYRKFRTTSTVLPGVTAVAPDAVPELTPNPQP